MRRRRVKAERVGRYSTAFQTDPLPESLPHLDRPTPGGRNLDSPPQEHPHGEHQSAAAYQTGSKERPIFVDIGHTPRSQREADQEAAKEFCDAPP